MLAAVARGHIRLVAALLAAGTDVNMMSPDGETPLWAAAANSQLEVMDLLLSHGADVNLAGGQSGWTALHRAAAAGEAEGSRYLLRHGADKNRRDAVDRTPLILAIMCRHVQCACVLLSGGADPNLGTARFGSPLNLAASQGNAPIVEALVEAGASMASAPYCLHNAIDVDSLTCVSMLLTSGADPDVINPEGRTPLTMAVLRGMQEAVCRLLQHNCDTELESHLRVGSQLVSFTPLEIAVASSDRLATALLLAAGASTRKLLPYLRDPAQLQVFRRCIGGRCYRNKRDAAEWVTWMQGFVRTPRRLTQICRTVLRRTLPAVEFPARARSLPLPQALIRYLCLDHLDVKTGGASPSLILYL